MATTSHVMSLLAEPKGDERISERTLGYVTEMAREEVFDLVARSCVENGVQRASIGRRLGKDPAQITRLLSAPGNWTIDTVAELLFSIDGSMLRALSYRPLEEPSSNRRHPNCLEDQHITIRAGDRNPVVQYRSAPASASPSNRAAVVKVG